MGNRRGAVMQMDDAFRDGAGKRSADPRRHEAFPGPGGVNAPVAVADTLRARSHRAMGTEFAVYLDAADDAQAQACFDIVLDEIDRLELTFSRFHSSSELSRLNRHAAEGPVVTDPEVFQLLASALDVQRKDRRRIRYHRGPIDALLGLCRTAAENSRGAGIGGGKRAGGLAQRKARRGVAHGPIRAARAATRSRRHCQGLCG